MADPPILLDTLLGDGQAEIRAVVAAGSPRADAAVLARALGSLGDAADSGLRAACHCDLVELLVEGWGKAHELREYGDKARHPPPSTTRMALAEHPMTIAIDPALTLVVGGKLRYPLRFIAEFVVTVTAARLTIIDGQVAAVELGSLLFAAQLRWGNAVIPLPLKTREMALPGHFTLNPRYSIPQ